MKHLCKYCNYSTDVKFAYEKHLNTKKHAEKVSLKPNDSHKIHTSFIVKSTENKYNCKYCDSNYSSAANLARHDKSCFKKNQLAINYEKRISELEAKLLEQNKLLETQLLIKDEKLIEQNKILAKDEEMINILKSEVTHLKSIVNNAGSIIKTSVSTVAYVLKNYKDAPALESVKDYSAIHYKQDNSEFVENLIYEHTHNKLHIYIGDFIIKTYKKEDPSKQSIWNSDTSRLTYLIREIINNNKVDWKIDKKGIKTTKFIIEPILEYIDEQVRNYIESYEVDHKISAKEAERQMMKLANATYILKSIEDKILSDDILKYITPHFYLNKNDNLIE